MSITLLAAVQEVLPRINSDSVNSINDTPDAEQVALICASVYRDMVASGDYDFQKQLIQLNASGDNAYPTHMKLPVQVAGLQNSEIRYNKKLTADTSEKWTKITYVDPDVFLDIVMSRDSSATDTDVVTDFIGGTSLLIKNDKMPDYYTSFDDTWLIFDSYDSAEESTLQQVNTQARVEVYTSLVQSDSTIVPIPPKLQAYYINKCVYASQFLDEGFDRYAIEEQRRQEKKLLGNKNRVRKQIVRPTVWRR